jgi:hypothetical protein
MKKGILILLIISKFPNYIFSHENMNYEQENELEMTYQSVESNRKIEQLKIQTFEDLECTYWTPEIEESGSGFSEGYIFLPNNTVLIVKIYFESMDADNNGDADHIWYSIYSIDSLYSYDIRDEKLILSIGKPIIILRDSWLYITYNEKKYEKYRLENRFINYINFVYPNGNVPIPAPR